MKKLTSILLLSIFLFNMVGYKLFFLYLEQQANWRMESKLELINENDLIAIKVPIRLPYQTDWKEFERVDGEMTIKGITYKYVKRKILRDTLILLCVNFKEKTTLKKGSNDYYKNIHGLTAEHNKKGSVKTYKVDYYQVATATVFTEFSRLRKTIYFDNVFFCVSGFLSPVKLPPKQLA